MNILLAMIPAFFWGTTYAVTQYSLTSWPSLLLGTLRALPAGLILFAIKPSVPTRGNWKPLLAIGVVNIAAFFSLIFVMALTLPSAISGVGMISVPVFAMGYHWLVNRSAPSVIQLISGALLVGLAWLLFDPQSIALNPRGLIAMLAAIGCIILGSSLTKSMGGKIHWWTVLTWQLLLGGIALGLATTAHAVINPKPYFDAVSQLNGLNIGGLIWITILNTAFSYSLYVWLLQRMSIVDFTFGGIANPVAGIVCGGFLMHEVYTLHQYSLMAGMIMVSLLPQCTAVLKSHYQQKYPVRNSCQ